MVKASELANHLGKTVNILGYSICRKTTATKQHELMGFDAWYDADGNYFNSVIFPGEMKQYPTKGTGIYLVQGKVTEEFGVVSIVVQYLERLPCLRDGRFE
ncbi:MAG: hypothetical protein IPO07_28560 [Haliscomenobacter sp.]|nr:hypothetical protein [Haliscomenobacter sp.]MBK9492301.1 hypothetical protein [Haliscomenobacter sp.]